MGMIVRHARLDDVYALAPNLRTFDRMEVEADGSTPVAALRESFISTDCPYTIMIDGEVAAMFGVSEYPADPNVGVAWFLGSPAITEHPREFLRESRVWVPILAKRYGCLFNVVDSRYRQSLRWLKWLGFREHGEISVGPKGLSFTVMVWEKDDGRHGQSGSAAADAFSAEAAKVQAAREA